MIYFHTLHFYLILASGTIFPIFVFDTWVPIHTVYISMYTLFIMKSFQTFKYAIKPVLKLLPFFLVLLFSTFRSQEPSYAIEKIDGAIFCSAVLSIIAIHVIKKFGLNLFLDALVKVSFIVLCCTIVHRVASGFPIDSRAGRFLFNGPIVFGWIMGMNGLISVYLFAQNSRKIYLILALLFFLAIVWTGSKGPLLATIIIITIIALINIRKPKIWLFIITCIAATPFIIDLIPNLILVRLNTLIDIFTNAVDTISNQVSLTVRSDSWFKSIDIFKENPIFGVGLGNWEYYSSIHIKYPHNLFFELSSELGIIGLLVFGILAYFCVTTHSRIATLIFVYFVLCLSFSGDISYYRFLFSIPLALSALKIQPHTRRHLNVQN